MAVGVEICERIKHTTKPNKPLCIKLELEIYKRVKRINNNNWSMTSKHFVYKMHQQQLNDKDLLKTNIKYILKCKLTTVFPLNVQLVNVAEPPETRTAPPYHMTII